MCGIVGYVGSQKAATILIEGLKRLEYRGYDSAGIALWRDNGHQVIKKTGRVDVVSKMAAKQATDATMGISHTRWATHGGVTDANAHPHLSSDSKFALVHNGVIENYNSLKKYLMGHGYSFQSETDTEVLANLIAYHYEKEPVEGDKNRFLEAVRKSLLHIEGTYGIGVICTDFPGEIVGARKGSPLCIGVGKDEHMLASDVSAFVGRTPDVVYMEDGQIAHLTQDGFNLQTIDEETVDPVINQIDWEIEQAELGEHAHYMIKEIFEQPEALENAMRGRFSDDESSARFGGFTLSPREFRQIDRVLLCSCGTAWHACLVAEHLIERYARIPVEVEYASEFRYRNAPLDKNTLVFVISQSGETLDTLEALREAKRKGFVTMAINNGVGSTIARESDGGIYQHAGPEIGVASTKAFTSQLIICAMVALHMGRTRDLSFSDGRDIVRALKECPRQVAQILGQAEHIQRIAKRYAGYNDFLFLGRQMMFPIALEGALKLKEISYIHAEGYPAGEMKHGPIALICKDCPSVIFAPRNDTYKKVLANIQEIKARGGDVIVITSGADDFPDGLADEIIDIPMAHECVMPILATIPIQLLAYYVALERGCDVDKPRNLAKSVTVE